MYGEAGAEARHGIGKPVRAYKGNKTMKANTMRVDTMKAAALLEALQGREVMELEQNLSDARALAEATQAEMLKARDGLRHWVAREGGSLGNIINANWANWWRRYQGIGPASVPPLPVMDLRGQSEEAREDKCFLYTVSAEFGAAGELDSASILSASPYALRPCLGTFGDVRKAWLTSGSKDSWAWGYAPRVAKHWAESTRTGLACVAEGKRAPFMMVMEQDFYHGLNLPTGGGDVDRQTYRLMMLMVEHHYAMLGAVVAANHLRNVRRAMAGEGKRG